MAKRLSMLLAGLTILASDGRPAAADPVLPSGFVRLRDVAPGIEQHMRYAQDLNFTGKPVPGYEKPECILARPVALALKAVHEKLSATGLSLAVFDCYRPQRSVAAFMRWAQRPEDRADVKSRYYPRIDKSDIIPQGYVARQSRHSKGTAVDLTIVRNQPDAAQRMPPSVGTERAQTCLSAPAQSGIPWALDMGTNFDCFDAASATQSPDISAQARANRELLLRSMAAAGFANYAREW